VSDPRRFDPSYFRVYGARSGWAARGPLGCLVALVLCPVGLVVGLVALVWALLPFGKRRRVWTQPRRHTPEEAAKEQALRRLVEAMSLDETFTAEEARQAGTLVAGGATVDDLLAEAIERGWVEVRGDRLAVTAKGKMPFLDPPSG
jgi:hypothetical protein